MFGSRNTIGATIMPATAPIAAARPQPSASIQPTRIPTSRAERGFCAAARIASPSLVKRKNRPQQAEHPSVTADDAELCWLRGRRQQAFAGKAIGNGLSV